jgi:HK97 family phage prohead protease
MIGHFAVFNRWTEIDSFFEGQFMERIAPGAFKKTFKEQSPKVLFQHGHDPQIGSKPLGSINSMEEDDTGARYDVSLLDADYVREALLPGLRAGLYGASFRFRVVREEIDNEPEASDDNPAGIPERTIKEAQVFEFGPVTFPAYAEATAGIRSITDDYLRDGLANLEWLARLDPVMLRRAADLSESARDELDADTDSEKEGKQDESEDAAGSHSRSNNPPEDKKAAPEKPSTPPVPLYGGRKETWRL